LSDFTALPVYDGVGVYHFNRYRVVFIRPSDKTKTALASDFVSGFPTYFTSPHANVVAHSDRKFNGANTLEFHGILDKMGLDIARPHNDWVAKVWENVSRGFTAQTLKREFWVAGEDLAAAGGGAVGGGATGGGGGAAIGSVVPGLGTAVGAIAGGVLGGLGGAGTAVHWNRMHFLAGRRSWLLDDAAAFGITPRELNRYFEYEEKAGRNFLRGDVDLCVLETAAVERFSSRFFQVGDLAMGLEDAIPPIWTANLANFVGMKGLWSINPASPTLPLEGWDTRRWLAGDFRRGIYYYRDEFDTLDELKGDPEFVKAYRLYPTLLP
jgi:hypothetical protein